MAISRKKIDEAKQIIREALSAGCTVNDTGNWLEFHGKEALQLLGVSHTMRSVAVGGNALSAAWKEMQADT